EAQFLPSLAVVGCMGKLDVTAAKEPAGPIVTADPWQFPGLPSLGEKFLGLGVRLGEGFTHRLHGPGSLVKGGGEDVGEFAVIAVAQLPPRVGDEVEAIDLFLRERSAEYEIAHSVEERRVHGSPINVGEEKPAPACRRSGIVVRS